MAPPAAQSTLTAALPLPFRTWAGWQSPARYKDPKDWDGSSPLDMHGFGLKCIPNNHKFRLVTWFVEIQSEPHHCAVVPPMLHMLLACSWHAHFCCDLAHLWWSSRHTLHESAANMLEKEFQVLRSSLFGFRIRTWMSNIVKHSTSTFFLVRWIDMKYSCSNEFFTLHFELPKLNATSRTKLMRCHSNSSAALMIAPRSLSRLLGCENPSVLKPEKFKSYFGTWHRAGHVTGFPQNPS